MSQWPDSFDDGDEQLVHHEGPTFQPSSRFQAGGGRALPQPPPRHHQQNDWPPPSQVFHHDDDLPPVDGSQDQIAPPPIASHASSRYRTLPPVPGQGTSHGSAPPLPSHHDRALPPVPGRGDALRPPVSSKPDLPGPKPGLAPKPRLPPKIGHIFNSVRVCQHSSLMFNPRCVFV